MGASADIFSNNDDGAAYEHFYLFAAVDEGQV